MVEIRDYNDSDYEDVKQNLQEGGLFNPSLDTREILKRKIEDSPDSIIVAIEDSHAIGNVYFIHDAWQSFIFRLAVREAYRGKGIGRMLMQEAERRLKERGVKEASLFIKDGNELEQYYQSQGYYSFPKTHRFMHKGL